MQAIQIITQSPTPAQPTPPTGRIHLTPARPMTTKQAGQLLTAWSESLRVAGLALLAFRLHLDRCPALADLETTYNLIIADNGLHTFLTPGDAADLAAAVEVLRRAEGE